MEIAEAIFFKKINPSDLLNIDYALHTGGGGQTYFDLAGISENDLCLFLEYGTEIERSNPPAGDTRIKYGIQAIAIGTDESKLIEFDPRNNRPNYKLSDQRSNRHPAWTERFGFPHSPVGARYANEVTNIPHLLIYIIRTNLRRYYAGFLNVPDMPNTWPVGIGLERLFQGERKGIYFFGSNAVMFTNQPDSPFSILTAETHVDIAELPEDIATQATDAVEYIDEDIDTDINDTHLSFNEHGIPTAVPVRTTTALAFSRHGRHVDYIRAQRNRTRIGIAGEKAVVYFEKQRLIDLGRPDLAERIEWVSHTQGDGVGYDIRSFDCVDDIVIELYIEVKTTTGAITKPFDISINEVSFSEENAERYVLFRVFQFSQNTEAIHFYRAYGAIREHFTLSPTSFSASAI